ncbi:MAG: hypothetical protein LBH06_02720 [Rikenellaceae bacterium]|jgi:hypothetical protein|nr:hypothetical protein [Rikenellaceae bacterium]
MKTNERQNLRNDSDKSPSGHKKSPIPRWNEASRNRMIWLFFQEPEEIGNAFLTGDATFWVVDRKFALYRGDLDVLKIYKHRFQPFDNTLLPLVDTVGPKMIPQVPSVMVQVVVADFVQRDFYRSNLV